MTPDSQQLAPAAGQRFRRTRLASEQVAVQIQDHIHEAGLAPGDFLGREADLATELGVSRPTLREALRLLASGQLIRATKGPGGGIFVAHSPERSVGRSLSESTATLLRTGVVTLDELVEALMLLEVPLAGLAAYRADDGVLEHLRDVVRAQAAAHPDNPEALDSLDAEFHRAIASASGNRMIQTLTDWVFEVAQPSLMEAVRKTVVPSALLEQHEAILAAFEKGDAARAERAMKDHLLYLADVLNLAQAQGTT